LGNVEEPRPNDAGDADEGAFVKLRAEWGEALRDAPINFSDQIIGSFRGDFFVLSFGQVQQPQFQPGDEVAIEALRETGTVPIRVQFRTAIPASAFRQFLDAIVKVAESNANPFDADSG
jgi:hypothetical protein